MYTYIYIYIYQYIYYICILLNMYNLFTPCLSDLSQCVKSNVSENYTISGCFLKSCLGRPNQQFFWVDYEISLQNSLWCNSNNYPILKRLPGYPMTGMSHHFYSIGSWIGIWMVLSPNPCHQGACPAISSEKGPKWSPVDGFDMAIDHP